MKPEGFPYLKVTGITERPQYVKEDDREETYYEVNPMVLDMRTITPIYWHRFKVRNPDTLALENCVVLCFTNDSASESQELMIAETFPKFDKMIREWIDYIMSDENEPKQPE